jgi:hypothetical protein
MVAAFEKASGKVTVPSLSLSLSTKCWVHAGFFFLFYVFQKIPIKLCPRRPGDATAVYASTEKAKKELGWKYVVITFFPCIEVALHLYFFKFLLIQL